MAAHIDALKKTDPALAKELKNLYYSQKAFKEAFPGGLPEVKKFREAYDQLGGEEGIQGINAERAEWKQIDEKFAAGDATVLDAFAQQNPEGFSKLIPAALDKLAALDRDSYNHTLSGVFVSTLDSWRFPFELERMAENLSRIVDEKGQPLCARELKVLEGLAKQYDSLKELATKAPVKKIDETKEKDALASDRAAIAKERYELTTSHVSTATATYAKQKYDSIIPAEARNHKLNVEAMKNTQYPNNEGTAYDRFMREIDYEVARAIQADTKAVENIRASMTAGRKDEAVKLSNSKFDAVAGQAIKRVIARWATTFNPRGVTGKAGAQKTGTEQTQTPGVKTLKEAPDLATVDKSDPDWRTNYMMHSTAKLTTGQRVKW